MIRLALAALRHQRRLTAGLVASVAVTTALLGGGLAMGDGLRAALDARTEARLGPVDVLVEGPDAGFVADLATRAGKELPLATVAPILRREAVIAADDGSVRVLLVGADAALGRLAGDPDLVPPPATVRLSPRAAARLGVGPGDRLVLRVERPTALTRESALTKDEGRIVGLSVDVGPLLGEGWPSTMAFDARPDAPDVALVDLGWLGERVQAAGRADALLVHGAAPEAVQAAIEAGWSLDDAGLHVVDAVTGSALVADRVLLPPGVGEAALSVAPVVSPGLVWLADSFRHDDATASYAFVGAVSPAGATGVGEALPDDLDGDQVVLTDWLAEELGAGPGDEVVLKYPVLGAARAVDYGEVALKVRAVVPVQGALDDPTWMPPIEGMSDQQDCRAWEPGLPVDVTRLGDRDEAWWDAHRGTPKAWVSLATGQRLWRSALGDLTTIRFPGRVAADVVPALRAQLDVGVSGLRTIPLRQRLTEAARPSNDFGALFAGFEALLLIAAVLLTALQASFGLEHRAAELGALKAIGFPRRRVRRLVLLEAAIASTVGAVIGIPLAGAVATVLAGGLDGAWSAAVSGASLPVVLRPTTLLGAALGAAAVSVLAVALTARRLLRREPRALLAGVPDEDRARRSRRAWITAAVAAIAAVALVASQPAERTPGAAAGFFAAGGLVLVAVLAALRGALGSIRGNPLGFGAAARRPGRSLAVAMLLGGGAFLVAGVGLGGGRAEPDAHRRDGGAGGFALWGETTLPLLHHLDSEAGSDAFGLPRGLLAPGSVVPLRRVDGDDASCLNLGSAPTPTLLGVDPGALAERGAFAGAAGAGSPWEALRRDLGPGRIAAIGDEATVTWALHKREGDVLTWTDEAGRPLEVQIVDVVGTSVLQGALVVDEAALRRHFPSKATWRTLLVEAEDDRVAEVRTELERSLADVGGVFTPTVDRLRRFAEVEATYVAIFRALGGLGLLLGAVGVGLVLARSVVERAAELGTLRALGFPRRRLRALLVAEHVILVLVGLGGGTLAAAIAVVPVLRAPDAAPPLLEVGLLLGGTALVAYVALQIAAAAALAGAPLRELARDRR